jgi:hypothetical protein
MDFVVPTALEMKTQWAVAPNLMSVPCSGGWVNEGLGHFWVGLSLGKAAEGVNVWLWSGEHRAKEGAEKVRFGFERFPQWLKPH